MVDRISITSAISLATLDPSAPLDDLDPLKRLIDDNVRIVAVGESVHAAHEFYALRHRLVRFLVERMGFTALAWESGFPESFLINDYIHGGKHDRERTLVDGMTMHMGRCQEMGEFIDWLRRHNGAVENNGNLQDVRFYGLDLPGSSAPLMPALAVVAPYVESVDAGFGIRLARLRELAGSPGPTASLSEPGKIVIDGPAALSRYLALSVADRNELTGLLADLAARFDAMRRTYVERSEPARYEVARQHLRVAVGLDLQLRAVAALMGGDAAACEGNIRDATMADTVAWILGRHERIVVLAHNGHVQRTPIATPTGTTESVDTLGVHLADRLGDGYLAIGTTYGCGEMVGMRPVHNPDGSYDSELYLRELSSPEPDTVDHLFDKGLSEMSLVDLRRLDQESAALVDAAPRMRMQDSAMAIDVRRAFDLLIHVPRVSLWTSSLNAMLPDERAGKTADGP